MFLPLGPRQDFKAHLAHLNLSRLQLVRARETIPRLALIALPPGMIVLTFPTDRAPPLIYDGMSVTSGEYILHGPSQRFFQRTVAGTGWGSISLLPEDLSAFARAMLGDFALPSRSVLLRPPRAKSLQLLRLHAQAGRLAQAGLRLATHPEVLRGLEQEVSAAFVACLEHGEADDAPWRHDGETLARLEAVVNANADKLLSEHELARQTGVSKPALQALCGRALGMSSMQFQRRVNLESAHAELAQCAHPVPDITGLAERHGFHHLDQFITEYLDIYGELPA